MSQNNISWIEEEIAGLKEAGLFTTIRTIDSPMDAWITIDNRRMLNFCANNYLGLANHPRVKAFPIFKFSQNYQFTKIPLAQKT